jgi:hypothetical protein
MIHYPHDFRQSVLLVVEISMLNNMQVGMDQAVPSPRRPGFDPIPVPVELVVQKVVLA